MNMIKSFLKDESGQALSEYGLIIGVIAVVAIAVLQGFGKQIKAVFNDLLAAIGGTKV